MLAMTKVLVRQILLKKCRIHIQKTSTGTIGAERKGVSMEKVNSYI